VCTRACVCVCARMRVCVRVYVCVCMQACARACVCWCWDLCMQPCWSQTCKEPCLTHLQGLWRNSKAARRIWESGELLAYQPAGEPKHLSIFSPFKHRYSIIKIIISNLFAYGWLSTRAITNMIRYTPFLYRAPFTFNPFSIFFFTIVTITSEDLRASLVQEERHQATASKVPVCTQ